MSAILLSIVVLLAAAGIAFVNQRSFGRLPRGERLERIRLHCFFQQLPVFRQKQFTHRPERILPYEFIEKFRRLGYYQILPYEDLPVHDSICITLLFYAVDSHRFSLSFNKIRVRRY